MLLPLSSSMNGYMRMHKDGLDLFDIIELMVLQCAKRQLDKLLAPDLMPLNQPGPTIRTCHASDNILLPTKRQQKQWPHC